MEAIQALPGEMFSSPELVVDASARLGKPLHPQNIGYYLKVLERHGYLEILPIAKKDYSSDKARIYKKKYCLDHYETKITKIGYDVNYPHYPRSYCKGCILDSIEQTRYCEMCFHWGPLTNHLVYEGKDNVFTPRVNVEMIPSQKEAL